MIDRVLIASRLDGDEVGEPVPVRFEARDGELLMTVGDMELAMPDAEVHRVLSDLRVVSGLPQAA